MGELVAGLPPRRARQAPASQRGGIRAPSRRPADRTPEGSSPEDISSGRLLPLLYPRAQATQDQRYVDEFALFSDSKSELYDWKNAVIDRLARGRLTIHESAAQVLPTRCGIPWLGFVVYPTHRLLKRRNAVKFTRRLERNIDAYQAGRISFGELDASVKGWVNHVRFADTWGLREHLFATHPIHPPR
jgi:hypothetical protein